MQKFHYLIILIFLSQSFTAKAQSNKGEKVSSINMYLEKEILKYTNEERKMRGLIVLEWNEKLSYAARYHAKDMAVNNYFSHNSYQKTSANELQNLGDAFERIESYIIFPFLAENISAGRNSAKSTVKAWMESPPHRKNILSKKYTQLGVGFYYMENSDYGYYWVQNFGGE